VSSDQADGPGAPDPCASPSGARRGLAAVAIVGLITLVSPLAAAAQPEKPRDGFEELLASEASDAMAAGDFVRAWHFYWRLLRLEPNDPRALRESGRAAHALGDFAYAEKALGRAGQLSVEPDPELHFLRAECLAALDRKDEAKGEYAAAERAIGQMPPGDRRATIWLGRIYAVRGEIDKARVLYEKQLWKDDQREQHTEILMYLVEANILANDWNGAEKILREYLTYWPDFKRGREMLAWVLEAKGDIEQELSVRRTMLTAPEASRDQMLAYARTLERAHDYGAALAHYREVMGLGIADVADDIQRMEERLAPEVASSVSIRYDPSGTALGLGVGGTMSFGGRRRIALTAGHEVASAPELEGIPTPEDVSVSQASARLILTKLTGATFSLGGTVFTGREDAVRYGGLGALRARPFETLQIQISGELNQPWKESSSTMREDGVTDSATAELYTTALSDRLVLGLTGRFRRLGLRQVGQAEPHANQWFGAAGLDWIALIDYAHPTRGEILDQDLLWPTGMAPSLIMSYRHYELDSENPFGARLVLVEQSRLDEASAVVREVLGDGVLGFEARGGVGYDWLREVQLWRAGSTVLISVVPSIRFSFDFDLANESGTGLTGRRYAGIMGLHVDL
jgi:tetratricopeptide (TPR) repeat protein